MQDFFHETFIRRSTHAFWAFLFPLVIGLPLITWQTSHDLQNDIRDNLKAGNALLDSLVQHAEIANERAAPYLRMSCDNAQPYLADLVAITPDVRSIHLSENNKIYCDSLGGKGIRPINESFSADEELLLLQGNKLSPNHSALIFLRDYDEGTVFSGVSSYYLRNILSLIKSYGNTSLHIGERWFNERGVVTHRSKPTTIEQNSLKYPYSLSTSLTMEDYWDYFIDAKHTSLLLLLVMSFGVGSYAFWRQGQINALDPEIRRAIRAQEFEPYIQPIMDIHGRMASAEVLMRWQHPSAGLIRPDLFIPLAEESGLIVPMTSQVMAKVRDQLAPYQSKIPSDFHISFNISAKHCVNSDLVKDCQHFLSAFNHPSLLSLELTERELIEDTEEARKLFAKLNQIGVRLAIDDFGTGHSSLNYLQAFQFDVLKIDQGFVRMIGSNAVASHIVDTLLNLAQRLNMQTVAEGIETAEQVTYFSARGVDYMQGYFYASPMPMDDFLTHLVIGTWDGSNVPTQPAQALSLNLAENGAI
ncbi:cyclic diguanylate phosphodiesterase [Vibrio mimicus]|uniref:EAL domain-containing protein n=1 Tax=Vibrio mimicus TaxID=674 RepID=UPI0011DBF157|nr:EAL domain-containing protein [Vibrio mimicus]TXY23219.1 cyclic diguanylate phosphodiesterase [Vibrio mimicus]